MALHILNTLAFAGLAALLAGPAVGVEPAAAAPREARPFVIGFLPQGSDLPTAPALLDQLATQMNARPALMAALERAGYNDLLVMPCDGARDMAQRLAAKEFAMAFASVVAYGLSGDAEAYLPVLQVRLPGDQVGPAGEGVTRQGVLIAGPASTVYHQPERSERQRTALLNDLASLPIAVPAADSAAGYIYPRLRIGLEIGLRQPMRFLFCGSDSEVVKHVVTGLVPLGCCRHGELARLLPTGEQSERPPYRIVLRSKFLPSDPVLLRREFAPANSDAGRELVEALRAFFNTEHRAGVMRLEASSPAVFATVASDLTEFSKVLVESDAAYSPQALSRFSRPRSTVVPSRRAAPLASAAEDPSPVVAEGATTAPAALATSPVAPAADPPAARPAPSVSPQPPAAPLPLETPRERPALPPLSEAPLVREPAS